MAGKDRAKRTSGPVSIWAWLLSGCMIQPLAAQPPTEAPALPRVFEVFGQWDKSDSGGCAVSVVRDGQILASRAYGQANVEARVRNSPSTAFQLASVSKQFTAFAVHLLAAEGRLSLDDSVREHIPELGAWAQPITVEHLLHHSSGLRDTSMLSLKGGRAGDIVTQRDVLDTLYDQRELNFPPGSRYLYSNSNYILLARIVERASGRPFAEFLKTRLFAPLGMNDTYLDDDPRAIRHRQAMPYGHGAKGLERRFQFFAVEGSSNIRSTANDMALWTQNLIRPRVGTPEMIAAMRQPGRDNSGKPLSFASGNVYASGLIIGSHRGLETVEHGGIEPGGSTYFLLLPSERLGVSLLCNLELNGLHMLSRGIADAYMIEPAPPAEHPSPAPAPAPGDLERFAGTYKEPGGLLIALVLRDGKLYSVAGQDDELLPAADGRFVLKDGPTSFSFPKLEGEGPALQMIVHDPDRDRRFTRVRKQHVPDLLASQVFAYEGAYYSPELETIVKVERRGEEMWLSGPGYAARLMQPPQAIREKDGFFAEEIGLVFFRRSKGGEVTELAITTDRVSKLRFPRLPPLPAL